MNTWKVNLMSDKKKGDCVWKWDYKLLTFEVDSITEMRYLYKKTIYTKILRT